MRAGVLLPGTCRKQREAACSTKLLLVWSLLASAQAKSAGTSQPSTPLRILALETIEVRFVLVRCVMLERKRGPESKLNQLGINHRTQSGNVIGLRKIHCEIGGPSVR